jgi:hypothetical protein
VEFANSHLPNSLPGTVEPSHAENQIAAEELAEMIRDGLAEEGHEVHVHPNPETGWSVALISANNAEDPLVLLHTPLR